MKERSKIVQLSDEELLNKYIETVDSKYFGILYNKYIPLVYGLSLKYLQNEDKAQDAVMDLFEELLSKVLKHKIDNFKTWLYSVAKNHCLHIIRGNKKEIIIDFNTEIMESKDILYLLEEQGDEDKLKALENCIKELPEPQRISIEKFFWQEESYTDIVESTGYHLKSVKSYIQNGKRNLKICLEKKQK